MKIVICSSIEFTPNIKKVSDQLENLGHEVIIPLTSQMILDGELTLEEFKNEPKKEERKIKGNVIKGHYNKIKNADAVLIVNEEKKGISGYIGGNTFLELGFAHILDKPIYLLNPIPEMSYTDEIKAMLPIVINNDLSLIK